MLSEAWRSGVRLQLCVCANVHVCSCQVCHLPPRWPALVRIVTPAISSSEVSSSFRLSPFSLRSSAPRRWNGPSLQLFSLFTKHTPLSSLFFPAPVRLCLCSSEEKMFPNLRQGGCVRNMEALSGPRRRGDSGWTLLPALMGAWRDLGG